MYRKDFIERLIEQVAEVLARVLGLSAGDESRGIEEIDRVISGSTGFTVDMLLRLEPRVLLNMLSAEKLKALIPLLEGRAILCERSQRSEDANVIRKWVEDLKASLH